MKVKSLTWGETECTEQDVFHFTKGIPGFEQLTEFVLIKPDPGIPFYSLQSVTKEEVDFLLVDPFIFYPDYEFELSEKAQEELEIEQKEQVQVYAVITAAKEMKDSTLNLLAPIVLNTEKQLGAQVILHGTEYETKHPLMPNQGRAD